MSDKLMLVLAGLTATVAAQTNSTATATAVSTGASLASGAAPTATSQASATSGNAYTTSIGLSLDGRSSMVEQQAGALTLGRPLEHLGRPCRDVLDQHHRRTNADSLGRADPSASPAVLELSNRSCQSSLSEERQLVLPSRLLVGGGECCVPGRR